MGPPGRRLAALLHPTQARHEVAFLMLLREHPNAELFYHAGDIISDSEASEDDDDDAAAREPAISLCPTISGAEKEKGIKCLEFGGWPRQSLCLSLAFAFTHSPPPLPSHHQVKSGVSVTWTFPPLVFSLLFRETFCWSSARAWLQLVSRTTKWVCTVFNSVSESGRTVSAQSKRGSCCSQEFPTLSSSFPPWYRAEGTSGCDQERAGPTELES